MKRKKTLFASKYEAIIRHIRIKGKHGQLEKVRKRRSGVAEAVRKRLGTASLAKLSKSALWRTIKTEKAASIPIEPDKALSCLGLEKRQKLEIG